MFMGTKLSQSERRVARRLRGPAQAARILSAAAHTTDPHLPADVMLLQHHLYLQGHVRSSATPCATRTTDLQSS